VPHLRRALIVGIAGQDGSYLAEFLLRRGYEVFGLVRRSSGDFPDRLTHISEQITLIRGDLLDQLSLNSAIAQTKPHEVYNFGGTSFIPESWQQPALTSEYTAMGVVRLLEAIRQISPETRFYQASSSEIFGRPVEAPQDEDTPFNPRNPYGVAKLFGHLMAERYREGYGLFAVSGLLYNHESPRRGPEFVTRKITHAAAAIALGRASGLSLGNLEAKRDWGFAGDYVHAMWLMLQQHEPAQSYVIATGELHSVRDVLDVAFDHLGLDWERHVTVDSVLMRPLDNGPELVGRADRAREHLGWSPTLSFDGLIRLMVDADLARLDPAVRYTAALDWPAGSPLLVSSREAD
jgi:GDPmannose 4,6-dehydratase